MSFFKKIIILPLALLMLHAQASDTLRIGIEGEYPPFSEVDQQGKLIGFDVDIAKALCADLKRDCELVQISWDGLIPALKAKKIDAIIASMSATEERLKSVDFTKPYYANIGRIVMPEAQAAELTDDNLLEKISGKVIGVQRATIHDLYATQKWKNVVKEIKRYNSQDDVNLDLVAGRVDFTMADQVALSNGFLHLEQGKGYAFAAPKIIDRAVYGPGVSIAVRKGEESLRDSLSQAILNIRASGVYQEINARYFTFDIYDGVE